jgi:hypothetical protein
MTDVFAMPEPATCPRRLSCRQFIVIESALNRLEQDFALVALFAA